MSCWSVLPSNTSSSRTAQIGLESRRLRLRLMMVVCDCLGVAGRVALESAGLGASILLCEPEGERRGSASDGLTKSAISMLAELRGLHKYALCLCSL